ncbi:MAG: YfjI family protein [Solirubrobacteraceae bacterium]
MTDLVGPTVSAANGHAQLEPAQLEPHPYLLERGFSPQAITEAAWRVEHLGARHVHYGLRDQPGGAEALVWLIPYRHRNGQVWFERIRFIHQADLDRFGGGKYRQPAGHSLALYDPYLILGDESFEPRDSIVLIEGEANTVAFHSLLPDVPVVGLPGQKALTPALAAQLGHIPVVYLWIDRHDPAADQNADRIAERLGDAGVDEVRQLPAFGERDCNEVLREFDHEQSRQMVLDMLAAAEKIETSVDADDWPPLFSPTPPPFPIEALPEVMADFVRAVAVQYQVPVDLPAIVAIGVLATVGMSARLDCVNWSEDTLGLYLLVASPSGDRKSTVMKKVAAPLYRIEQEAREEFIADDRDRETKRKVLQARESELVRRAAKDEDVEDRAVAQAELDNLRLDLDRVGELTEPRLLVNNTTPEALVDRMAENSSGIAAFAAEPALIENLLGHYSEKGNPNLSAVCEAYTADYTSVDRRGGHRIVLPRPLLTITLLAQDDVLETLLGNVKARKQGLIGRFAFIDAAARHYVGKRQIQPPPPTVPKHLNEAWDAIVRRVRDACRTANPAQPEKPESGGPFAGFAVSGELAVLELSLSPSSKNLLTELELAVEPRLADGADLEFFRDWMSRHHGRAARIASLFHLVEQPGDPRVGENSMRGALKVADYFLAHALAALTTPDALVRRAMAWLSRQLADGVTIVSQKDILDGPLGKNSTAADARNLAQKLVDARALRPAAAIEEPPNPKGGRPKGPRYEINPHLRDL